MTSLAEYRGVRAAVLGASGFIGRWVARALYTYGAETILVVRDQAGFAGTYSRYGLCGRVLEADFRYRARVEELFRYLRPSITFNLTGYGVDHLERNEQASFQVNADLTQWIGEAVSEIQDRGWPGADLVHAGSALEYGAIGGDLREDSQLNPTTVYGQSKLAGTRALARLAGACGLKAATARLFTVYGPGEHQGRLLPTLVESAKSGREVELTAGLQKRDFTYVEDVAEGFCRLGLADAKPGEAVNLATGRLTSVRNFAETAASVLQISAERLKFGKIQTRIQEMEHSEVRVSRLRDLTGWVPPTTIDDGIVKTAEFLRNATEGLNSRYVCRHQSSG